MIFWFDRAKLYWPEDDSNPETAYDWCMKHLPDVDHTIQRCKKRRTVVQAGAHVGLWPLRLAKHFERVFTFEVQPSLQMACAWNIENADASNITLFKYGLSDKADIVLVSPRSTAGSWRIEDQGTMPVSVTTIDSFELTDCDAIILDIEGHEVQALKGAQQTIKKYKPIIHVEELSKHKVAIQAHMKSIGYKTIIKIHKDVIYKAL